MLSASTVRCAAPRCAPAGRLAPQARQRWRAAPARAEPEGGDDVKYNKEFGYSRKDVILIGVGLTGFGYALYYGLQAAGVGQLMAGNITQLIIFVGLCVGWIGSYVFRVANKARPSAPHADLLRCL